MYLLSVFGGGLFIIPLLTIAGAAIFARQAYKAHNSNSTEQQNSGSADVKVQDNTGNVPYTEIGQFWLSVALAAFTIVIIILMIADK